MTKQVQLTARQTEVVQTIRTLQRSLRRAPTQQRIAEALGIKKNTVSEHVTRLAMKGAVDKYGKVNRLKYYDLKV